MKYLMIIFFTVLWLSGFGQQPQTVLKSDTTTGLNLRWSKWVNDLSEMGIEQKNDSLFIKEEVIRLIKDSTYRNSIYPKRYEWPAVTPLLKQKEFKKAFWHMINIYMTDSSSRQFILGTFVLYDSLIEMDKILLNTFYTYAMTDPRVCRINNNNKPEIVRPDLLEKNLIVTKEIIYSILYYRKERANKVKN